VLETAHWKKQHSPCNAVPQNCSTSNNAKGCTQLYSKHPQKSSNLRPGEATVCHRQSTPRYVSTPRSYSSSKRRVGWDGAREPAEHLGAFPFGTFLLQQNPGARGHHTWSPISQKTMWSMPPWWVFMCMLIGWPGKLCNLIGWEPGVFQFADDLKLLQTRSPDMRSGGFGCYQANLVGLGKPYSQLCSPTKRQMHPQHLQRFEHTCTIRCQRQQGEGFRGAFQPSKKGCG